MLSIGLQQERGCSWLRIRRPWRRRKTLWPVVGPLQCDWLVTLELGTGGFSLCWLTDTHNQTPQIDRIRFLRLLIFSYCLKTLLIFSYCLKTLLIFSYCLKTLLIFSYYLNTLLIFCYCLKTADIQLLFTFKNCLCRAIYIYFLQDCRAKNLLDFI